MDNNIPQSLGEDCTGTNNEASNNSNKQDARLLLPSLDPEPPRRHTRTEHSTGSTGSTGSTRAHSLWKKIALSDIISPMETEAETAIFRAVDAHRRDVLPANHVFLPNIPTDSVHSFEQDTNTFTNHEETNDLLVNTPVSPKIQPSSAPASVASPGKISALPVALGETSLENTLFDLTTAMRDLHSHHEPTSRSRLPTEEQDHIPTHDQDAFVHNANLLFRRNTLARENLATTTATTATTRSKWNVFAGKNDDPKKNDENTNPAMEVDMEAGTPPPTTEHQRFGSHVFPSMTHSSRNDVLKRATLSIKEDFHDFHGFLTPRQKSMKMYIKGFLLYMLVPTLAISAILFYAFDNPKTSFGCVKTNGTEVCPSVSWFINFIFVRQAITYTMAKVAGIILIDFMALKTRVILRMIGPIPTLMFVQSRGWPFQLALWAIFSLLLNSGNNKFAMHWLYYQDGIDMFNDANPSGNITNGQWNRSILWNAILLGVAVAIKRFLIGLYLGHRAYAMYGSQLAKVIHNMIIIGQVSRLGRSLELRSVNPTIADSMHLHKKKGLAHFDWSWRGFEGTGLGDDDDKTEGEGSTRSSPPKIGTDGAKSIDEKEKPIEDTTFINKEDQFMDSSGRVKMLELLEAWEEPDREPGKPQHISISAILQFRQSLAFMDLSYPFSAAFGLADTRAHSVESAQGVYRRLMHYNPNNLSGVLEFDAIASLAKLQSDGASDDAKMKDLIRLFRPDRQGNLTMLDFVKSVDAVYKKLRLLRASINSSSQIDRATEILFNCFFYFTMFCVILSRLKIDPLKFFLSMSSVILAFAFVIGSASAKYFEGILFILVRRPYDIGDRIAISDPNAETSGDGSSTWFVENVDLYTTTVRFAATNEVATLANGALATSRIINAARSPRASVSLHLKFGVDVPYAKVQLFRQTVEEFVKARPREWLSLGSFLASKVETDLGFIEYVICCQHREAWQNRALIGHSKADLFSYCLEVQKQLGMRYTTPMLPVTVRSTGESHHAIDCTSSQEGETRAKSDTLTDMEGMAELSKLFTVHKGK